MISRTNEYGNAVSSKSICHYRFFALTAGDNRENEDIPVDSQENALKMNAMVLADAGFAARKYGLEKTLISNGFGTWRQQIVLDVDLRFSHRIATQLGIAATTNSKSSALVWIRQTTRRSDDESVVRELSDLLADLPQTCWSIDWNASQF